MYLISVLTVQNDIHANINPSKSNQSLEIMSSRPRRQVTKVSRLGFTKSPKRKTRKEPRKRTEISNNMANTDNSNKTGGVTASEADKNEQEVIGDFFLKHNSYQYNFAGILMESLFRILIN